MRWLKFTADGQTSWGLVEGDRVLQPGAPVAIPSPDRSHVGSSRVP